MSVFTSDGYSFFISDFDQMCDTDKLPRWVLVSKKQGINYGKMIQTSELFVN